MHAVVERIDQDAHNFAHVFHRLSFPFVDLTICCAVLDERECFWEGNLAPVSQCCNDQAFIVAQLILRVILHTVGNIYVHCSVFVVFFFLCYFETELARAREVTQFLNVLFLEIFKLIAFVYLDLDDRDCLLLESLPLFSPSQVVFQSPNWSYFRVSVWRGAKWCVWLQRYPPLDRQKLLSTQNSSWTVPVGELLF